VVSFPRDLVGSTLNYRPHKRLALTVTRDPKQPYFSRDPIAMRCYDVRTIKERNYAMLAGTFIGVLIGLVSGTVMLVLLRTASSASIGHVKAIIAITAEFLAIPTFWFGGPWLTSTFLQLVSLEEMLDPYIVSLTLTFLVLIFYPIFRWIVKMGNDFA
jgi:hypothetical protein